MSPKLGLLHWLLSDRPLRTLEEIHENLFGACLTEFFADHEPWVRCVVCRLSVCLYVIHVLWLNSTS